MQAYVKLTCLTKTEKNCDRQSYIPRYRHHHNRDRRYMCRDSRCQRRLHLVGNNAYLDLPVHPSLLPPPTKPPLTSTGSGVTLPSWHHYRYRHHNRLHRDSTRKLPISNRTNVRIAHSLYIVKPKDAHIRYEIPNTNKHRRRPTHCWTLRHTRRSSRLSRRHSFRRNRATNPRTRGNSSTARHNAPRKNKTNT
jgi:hypothetical protein